MDFSLVSFDMDAFLEPLSLEEVEALSLKESDNFEGDTLRIMILLDLDLMPRVVAVGVDMIEVMISRVRSG